MERFCVIFSLALCVLLMTAEISVRADEDDDTETGPDQLTACQREVEKARRQETVDGPMMVGVYVPHCDEQGNYHPLQFHPSTGYHWCVDEHGREITGTSTPPSKPAPDCSQFSGPDQLTACQREVEKARRQETVDGPMMVGVYVPHCDEHGNYHPLQFHPSTGYHWCVDEHGREITGTSTPPSEPAPDCSQFSEPEVIEPLITEDNGVLVLTNDNFDDAVSSNDVVLVEFYAPWCGHCKSLAPEYEKAAKQLKENDPPVVLAKVDATVENELASRFDVSGYPTLKWFKGGRAFDYEGPRHENGIVDFMKERSSPDWKPPPEALLVLTKDNFTDIATQEELVIVMFYAPWCGHCKRMLPEFEKAAQQLKESPEEGIVLLAKVDATVETDLATKYGVTGYPTLKVFRKGKVSKYKSDAREKWGIVGYINSLRGSASREIAVDDIARQVSKSDDSAVLIVGFFNSASDAAFETYEEATNEMREDYQFRHILGITGAAEKYKVRPGSVVTFLSERFQTKYEPKWQVLEIKDDTKPSDIVSFVEKRNVPLVGQYGRQTKDKAYKDRRPLVLFFYTVDWSFDHREATQAWRQKFAKIAKEYPTMSFAIADEEENSDLFEQFGFDESSEEVNVGIIGPKDRKYPMEPMEEFESDEVVKFLKTFMKGDVRHKMKSQPVPKKSSGPVTVVVGTTFKKLVLDNSKDVLIELYAPWCGHCKQLEPTYRDLAKRFKDVKNLVIAKMDATANDSPDPYTSGGFPTIYFAPAGKKSSPVSYSGDRSLKDLEKFIRDHATVSLARVKEEL